MSSTDSTYLPGLLNILKRLVPSKIINTIIPGRLYRSSSNLQAKGIELRLTTVTDASLSTGSNGSRYNSKAIAGSISQKVLARSSSQAQEVFLVYAADSFIAENPKNSLAEHLKMLLKKENCTIVISKASKGDEDRTRNQHPQSNITSNSGTGTCSAGNRGRSRSSTKRLQPAARDFTILP
mmetsp:Transcript_1355/g.2197  ORF Transcript_1355/g.2197 Transcript_1355/m.2197 type:complete len:181 (-) Transcript_1355:1044-1586(-)